jgi:hypothetical protein
MSAELGCDGFRANIKKSEEGGKDDNPNGQQHNEHPSPP